MTYTFKLARRLAVSRDFVVLATIALLAGCMGDATAPDPGSSGLASSPAVLQVSPRWVTIEVNQPVRFRGQSRNSRGEPVSVPVLWGATGGRINADGTFSSSLTGTFKITGRGRGWRHTDSSIVVVVSPPSDLARLAVTPDSVSVAAGSQQTFSATGYTADGSSTPVGVVWSATGGSVDPAGLYTADSAGGTFRVIASTTTGTLADTAVVVITPPAPPAPTLTRVILSPASVTLATGSTQGFRAYGRNSLGDSVAVEVGFSATGGTITSSGLYTAGSSGGTYRVIAAASGLSDTAVVTLATTSASGTAGSAGIPFGPWNAWDGTTLQPNTGLFTLNQESYSASNIVTRINTARAKGVRLMLAMTGGKHSNYMSTIDGVYQFDRSKWEAKMETYNTATIRDAVARAVADGTIIGASVMDEPHVSGSGDGNTWGPPGTMTKARVDSLCADVKAIFPSLPAGVVHRHDVFEPTKSYRVCDFIVSQYSTRLGSVTDFRDSGLALAKRDGHAIAFSLNILNGGAQDKDGVYDCTGPGQAGIGTYSPNCRMTPQQVRDYGLVLGPAGCGLLMWRYDSTYMANAANQDAFRDVASRLASLSGRACRRS